MSLFWPFTILPAAAGRKTQNIIGARPCLIFAPWLIRFPQLTPSLFHRSRFLPNWRKSWVWTMHLTSGWWNATHRGGENA